MRKFVSKGNRRRDVQSESSGLNLEEEEGVSQPERKRGRRSGDANRRNGGGETHQIEPKDHPYGDEQRDKYSPQKHATPSCQSVRLNPCHRASQRPEGARGRSAQRTDEREDMRGIKMYLSDPLINSVLVFDVLHPALNCHRHIALMKADAEVGGVVVGVGGRCQRDIA
jgi:hypothetical protein